MNIHTSNISSTRYTFCVLEIVAQAAFFSTGKNIPRNLFKECQLNAPTNPKTGQSLAPYHQLLDQWIVKAWDKVPKELVQKSWEVCGYKSTEDLSNQEETASVAVINYSQEQLGKIIENIAIDDAIMAWIDEANDHQPVFPKEDNDVSWYVGTD